MYPARYRFVPTGARYSTGSNHVNLNIDFDGIYAARTHVTSVAPLTEVQEAERIWPHLMHIHAAVGSC